MNRKLKKTQKKIHKELSSEEERRENTNHDIQGDEELSQNDELWDTAQNNE